MSGLDPTTAAYFGAIAILFATIAALYREGLSRSEKRVRRLEDREDSLLKELVKAVGLDAAASVTMSTQVTRILDYVTEEQIKARLLGQAQRLDRLPLPPTDVKP